MRVTAQGNDFLHRVAVADRMLLRQHTDLPGQLRRPEIAQVLSFQPNGSFVGNALSDGGDQRAFARAVRPNQHEPLAFFQRNGQAADGGIRAIAHGEIFHVQHELPPAFLLR